MHKLGWILPAFALASCVSAGGPGLDELRRRFEETRADRKIDLSPAPEESPALGDVVLLDEVISLARSRNAELRAALAKAEAAAEAFVRAGTLDDPAFKVQAENVPFHKPGPDQAEDHLFGLMQSFPMPEKLSLRAREALRKAEAEFERYRELDRAVIADTRKAFADYALAVRELEIHRDHARLLDEISKVAEAKYTAGTVQQTDVLKPQVELVRVHNEARRAEQRLASQRAELNRLMNRTGPLGLPKPLEATVRDFDLDALLARAVEKRPELAAAGLDMLAAEASRDLAEADATLPDVTVGADYWKNRDTDDGYGLTAGITLPWGNPRYDAEIKEREKLLRSAENTRIAARNRVEFDVRDAFAKVEAAKKTLALFGGELLPKSKQTVEAARAAYEADRTGFLDLLDADRARVDAEMGYAEALAAYHAAVADLDRAVGGLE